MDRAQIQSERIVERYLSGDLTIRAAREFEQFCRERPEVLESLPIPARIKSQLQTRSFDSMGTSVLTARQATDELTDIAAVTGLKVVKAEVQQNDDDEDEAPVVSSRLNKPLLVLLAVCLVALVYLLWQSQTQERRIRSLTVATKSMALRAASQIRMLKLVAHTEQNDAPDASVSLTSAEWLDLHIDQSVGHFKVFNITIEKADEDVRIMEMRRISIDSNKELRFALNSAAFSAGDYELKIEGLDYRGDPHLDGYVLIRMQ